MERYTVQGLTNLERADHAGRIEAFLQAQGIETSGAQVRWDELGRATVTVRADRNPAKALETYVPTLTTEEQARAAVLADAQAAIATISDKSREDRTPTEKVLLGLAVAASEPVLVPSTPEEPIDAVWPPATAEEPVEVDDA